MNRIKDFVSFWIYYPKLIKYLKRKNNSLVDTFKAMGRFRYAIFAERAMNNTRRIDMSVVDAEIEKWKSFYDKEPIEKK